MYTHPVRVPHLPRSTPGSSHGGNSTRGITQRVLQSKQGTRVQRRDWERVGEERSCTT